METVNITQQFEDPIEIKPIVDDLVESIVNIEGEYQEPKEEIEINTVDLLESNPEMNENIENMELEFEMKMKKEDYLRTVIENIKDHINRAKEIIVYSLDTQVYSKRFLLAIPVLERHH